MFRRLGTMLLLGLMLTATGCQPVMPEVVPEVEMEVATPEPVATETVVTGPLNVLCLGDHEIEANWGVCGHFAGMAAAADPPVVIVADHIVRDWGAWAAAVDDPWEMESTFKEFWETDEVRDRLSTGEWDWVVLYENLLEETIFLKDTPEGTMEIERDYIEYGGKLVAEIEQSGANTVLLVPRDHPTLTSSDLLDLLSSDDLVRVSKQITAGSNTRLAPAGPAWKRSKETYPEISLDADARTFAPTIEGTYLDAAVLYATILGRNPVGINYHPTNILPETGPSAFFRDKWKMTEEEAAILRQIAWDTVQEFQQTQ